MEGLRDLLPIYYSRLFPFKDFYRWLSYGNDETFANREFSFTLEGDIYLRFLSFDHLADFEKELKLKKPEKIDIGAVYNQRPKKRDSSGSFQPIQKEFVVDIDLTDYDDVRTCCSGATVCQKCWRFLAIAVQILNKSLTEDFGFKHLLWVYSGRRGVHCWVCDHKARFLSPTARSAVIEYLQVIRGGSEKSKKVKLIDPLHSFLTEALNIIESHFDTCNDEQEFLSDAKNLAMFAEHDELKKKLLNTQPDQRWNAVLQYINENSKKRHLKNLRGEILLQLIYPRLDINVSKGLNHLLKSPFCIHPKTGQVCVPFDPRDVFNFKITEAPKLNELFDEISKYDNEHKDSESKCKFDWEKTRLRPFMKIYLRFVDNLERSEKKLNNASNGNGIHEQF